MVSFFYLLAVTLQRPVIFASMSFGLPSVLLYIMEIVVICRHHNFRNSFYSLFVIRAFLDLMIELNSYVYFRLPSIAGQFLLPIYSRFLPNWALIFMIFTPNFVLAADNMATLFILLNRLSAILSPFGHEKLWRKLRIPSVAMIIGMPLLYFGRYFFGMQCGFYVTPDGERFLVIEDTSTHFNSDDLFLLFIICLIFFLLCLLINVAIFCAYKYGPSSSAGSGGERTETENKLLIYTICTSFGHVLVTLLTVWQYLSWLSADGLNMGAMMAQSTWVYDVSAIVLPSWLLLWASKEFRRQFCKDFVAPLANLLQLKKASQAAKTNTLVQNIHVTASQTNRPTTMMNTLFTVQSA